MKKFFCILLALMIVLTMAACGDKTPGQPAPVPSASSEPEPSAVPSSAPSADPVPEKDPEPVLPENIRLFRSYGGDYVTEEINGRWYNLATTRYYTLGLTDEAKIKYPGLEDYLQSYNAYIADSSNEQLQRYAENARLAIADMAGADDGQFYAFPFESTPYITRADSNAVSFAVDFYSYMGGIHPDTWVYCFNVDPKTGAGLELTDFVKDMDGLKALLPKKIKEKYPEVFEYVTDKDLAEMVARTFELSDEYDFNGEPTGNKTMDVEWLAGYQGITFHFNTYQLASYAAGPQQVTILAGEVPGLLYDEKLTAPEEYAVSLYGYEMEFDLDGDGEMDPIDVSYEGEYDEELEEYFIKGINVTTPSGSFYDDSVNGTDSSCFLVHLKDDTNIIICSLSDWYAGTLNLYDVTDRPDYCGAVPGWLDDGLVTDPSCIPVGINTQIAGTFYGVRNYHFGEYGAFSSSEKYYTLSSDLEIVTTDVLTLPLVTDPDKVDDTKTAMLPAGTRFTVVRSNNADYIDLMDVKSGKVYRLHVNTGEYSSDQTLDDGRSIYDVFECVYWAG